MGLGETLMKIVVKVSDVVELAKRFRAEPLAAMQEVATQVRAAVVDTLERVMDAEIDLVLGEQKDADNKRNGHTTRTFAIKGIGEVAVKVPRDRKGTYESKVVPPSRRYDQALEKGRGRDGPSPPWLGPPPARIPAGGTTAPGSCLGS